MSDSPSVPPGRFFEWEGRTYSEIRDHDLLPPFLMTVVSASNAWMFLSSRGSLTAGRTSPDGAVFPYVTDDKLHDSVEVSGPVTTVRVADPSGAKVWDLFARRGRERFELERRVAKSTACDAVFFEERNVTLGLVLRTSWEASERYGWIRRVSLLNESQKPVEFRILDGLLNVMPSGADRNMQSGLSTLLDAYRMTERSADSRLALIRLSSIPVDQPRPNESLRATAVFALGLDGADVFLSAEHVAAFRRDERRVGDELVRGSRGAYLLSKEMTLAAGEECSWLFAIDGDKDGADVVALAQELSDENALRKTIDGDLERGRDELLRLVASADGLQATGSPEEDARHYANTLFNVMRGGVFVNGYEVDGEAFAQHIGDVAPRLAEQHAEFLHGLPPKLQREELIKRLGTLGNAHALRLGEEYLPLTFSRRHGDPSRPWNSFSIRARDARGEREVYYEGNWRDIFQNWEALCTSFPGYAWACIARFVNASTADGYNPYRIDSRGVDWEVHDPEDPWSFIGYWGDHQVVYLARLLELAQRFEPGALSERLSHRRFVFVDVPYRIAGFGRTFEDPSSTVTFDTARAGEIDARLADEGNEARLLRDSRGEIVTVTLAEKLLTPLLVKLTNLVPGGGIWMNTQRPEWNDANNAIAGLGLSVVTTSHLHAALLQWQRLFTDGPERLELTEPVGALVDALHGILGSGPPDDLSSQVRREITERLGRAGEAHRMAVYSGAVGEARGEICAARICSLLGAARRWTGDTLRSNRRDDGLFHAYNLMRKEPGGAVGLRRLAPMLEGQVAMLSSGLLDHEGALALLRDLRSSDLYREDQLSYLLYPNRDVGTFLSRGLIDANDAASSASVQKLLTDGRNGIVCRASDGSVRFGADMHDRTSLLAALEGIQAATGQIVLHEDEVEELLGLYEKVFDHEAFPGRSMNFFGYEGLGCIYWHMVSKLILATQEFVRDAPAHLAAELRSVYLELRSGLGTHKSPEVYGAFPSDPYSHTRQSGGARQPGLTGQVKEDFLGRLAELGLEVRAARVGFHGALLELAEPALHGAPFRYLDAAGDWRSLELPAGAVALTYCGVPIVMRRGDHPRIQVTGSDGSERFVEGTRLDVDTSRAIFRRSLVVDRIDTWL